MKLHTGPLANPVAIETTTAGYRYRAPDAPETFVERPGKITRKVRRMFGMSARRWFVGVMICEEPESR